MTVEGKVAKILGHHEIVINRGKDHGVKKGMRFEIFSPEGEEVWDPDTGETLGTVEDIKAKAEVTEVKERLAIARVYQSGAPMAGFEEMQENLQRAFQQIFGEGTQVQGFGFPPQGGSGPDPEDLEEMFGGSLQDSSKIQIGDAAREIKGR
jgi:hypothetical protein